MTISHKKTQVMHVGKCRWPITCRLNGNMLKQVSEFKYLGCVFSEDGKFDKEFEHRRMNGNKVVSQLRSHVFSKRELSKETKMMIHGSIFRPTVLYGSESWVDSNNLIHGLEVADMKVLRAISGVSRRDQWDNRIRNKKVREDLNVESIEEAARKSRLRWFGHVQRMNESRLPKLILNAEVNGQRGSGRPRRRFLDSVKSDLRKRGYEWSDETQNLALDRVFWRGNVVKNRVESLFRNRPHAERH